MAGQEHGAQTVDRAIALLERFTLDRPSWTLTELAREMDLPVSTVHRVLKTLVARELLLIDGASRRYRLGPGVLRLARVILDQDEGQRIESAAAPFLSVLRTSTGETVALHRIVGRYRACVAELVSLQTVRTQTTVGGVQPLHGGAASKALIAWTSPAELDELLPEEPYPALTASTPRTRDALDAELAEVRERGYAVSLGETVAGAAALAAPIVDRTGRVVAAINITGPIERWNAAAMQRHLPELLAAARSVSAALSS